MSSAHVGLDIRIFHKECCSLARAGHETHLVIEASPDDIAFAAKQGVLLHSLPTFKSRLGRIFGKTWHCFLAAIKTRSDIFHFHDSELIPFAIILAVMGKEVIYDAHEDLPRDIADKEWIPAPIRNLVAILAEVVENFSSRYFFSVIGATPFITARFSAVCKNTETINNYPLKHELYIENPESSRTGLEVCYIGGINRIRGAMEMVAAVNEARNPITLNLCGNFEDSELELDVQKNNDSKKVNVLGLVSRLEAREVMARSSVGLVLFHAVPNHINAQPNKMFEYMSAGLALIASDFPLWRDIISSCNCGILVDPADPQAIARAIDLLVEDPAMAKEFGINGRKAVEEKFNWVAEEAKLITFYKNLSDKRKSN